MKDEIDLPYLKPGRYRHNKTNHFYVVLGVALSTETGEAMVIYKPEHESKYPLFARGYEMFVETVELNGEKVPRFEYIEG